MIAPGGQPIVPGNLNGAEHCITSDGFFELEHQPNHAIVVGAGYIAVEMAGVLRGLGSSVSLHLRGQSLLRSLI